MLYCRSLGESIFNKILPNNPAYMAREFSDINILYDSVATSWQQGGIFIIVCYQFIAQCASKGIVQRSRLIYEEDMEEIVVSPFFDSRCIVAVSFTAGSSSFHYGSPSVICWPTILICWWCLAYIFFFLFRRLIYEVAWQIVNTWSTVTEIYKFGSQILGPFSKIQRNKNITMSVRFQTTSQLDRKCLRNAARYRQSENGISNYDHFRLCMRTRSTKFDPPKSNLLGRSYLGWCPWKCQKC